VTVPAPEGRPPAAGSAVGADGSVKPVGPGLVNVANALTVLRICLVPVFVVCLAAGG
jgi:hypothetical protein